MRFLVSFLCLIATGLVGHVQAQEATPSATEQVAIDTAKSDVVVLETSMGNIEIALFPDKAPLTVQNFLKYVDEQYYDGTLIHRVIKDFIIQGGGLASDFTVKTAKDSIKNEAMNGLKNKRGTIAMARTGVVDSATSQFYINLKDNTQLDHRDDTPTGYGYAVFGEVISGMETVDRIASVVTGEKLLDPENKRGLYVDVPTEPVIVKSIRRKTVNP